MKNNNYKKAKDKFEVAANPVIGQPLDSLEMINKYGTYEIQPTADTDNEFPCIAQGKYKDPKFLKTHAESETKN